MSDHNKKVEPVRFEPAAGPAAKPAVEAPISKARRPAGENSWAIPALIGLVVVALLVFFWLPSMVEPDTVELEPPPVIQAKPKPSQEAASPYADAQAGKQRKAAQDILARLLEEQFALEEMGVEQWAAEEFAAAQALATTADEQYRQQEFLTAAETYQQALDAMLAISAKVDEVFQQQLEAGLAALRSDQAEAAIAALEIGLVIKPDDPAALAAMERARNLGPLLALMKEANTARDSGELEAAIDILKRATALDPEHPGAAAQLASVKRELSRRNFNRAMTAGFKALDDGRYDEAERQFKAAQAILPAATEPRDALEQTKVARTQAQIEAWRQRAVAAEQREDWNKAVSAYQEILDIDSTVVFARNGMARSRSRAQLDTRMKQALAKPERLSSDAIYSDTRAMYQQALVLENKGPLLREQLLQLSVLLEQARVPVPILLQSDELTDVTVYKVAHLGTFKRQQLTLKPGVYTAVGVRKGYRDVRKQFKVDHAEQGQVVEITCTEPI